MSQADLPSSWLSVELGDVSDVIRGITFPASSKEAEKRPANVCCLRTTNVQREIDWSDVYFVPRTHVKRADQLVRVGDVLMSMANSYELVGKVAVARHVPFETAFGAFLAAVRPRGDINGQYLFHLLRTPYVQRELRKGSSQTVNIANISVKALSTIGVPLAPAREQGRIADKLDAVLANVDACRERLDRVPAILKRFRDAVLEAAVSGRLTEEWRSANRPARWSAVRLKEVITGLEQGWSPKCEESAAVNDSKWGVIKTTAIQAMKFDGSHNKALPAALKPRPELEIKVGDLLITRAGPRVRAAVACLVEETRPRLIVCDKAYRFRADAERALPSFIAILLNSPVTVAELDRLKTGISDSGVNLTQEKFLGLKFDLPNLKEQSEIVRRVDELFALADGLEMKYRAAVERVERLTPSVLAKAFRGELVPQDPNDEPAEVLLARIREQRAGATGKQPRRVVRPKRSVSTRLAKKRDRR